MNYTIAVPASSIQKVLTYGIPSITSVSGGVAVANGTISITSTYPGLPIVIDAAYQQANVATGIATSSYNQANTATNLAQTAYDYANTISGGAAVDNVARVIATSASSNTIILQGVNITQNTNIATLNTSIIAVNDYASSAFAKANSALANTSGTFSGDLQITNSLGIGNSLGVGTAASGVSGEIRATDNITAYYSDDRLKKRLGNIENALRKIQSLTGFYYEANETAQSLGYKPKKEIGLSAQEVQKVFPEIVVPAPIDEQYLTIYYEKLIPVLVEAIKELTEKVDKLEKDRKL